MEEVIKKVIRKLNVKINKWEKKLHKFSITIEETKTGWYRRIFLQTTVTPDYGVICRNIYRV
jgi:hypothetical protein